MNKLVTTAVVIVAAIGIYFLAIQPAQQSLGSVAVSNEYQATTTSTGRFTVPVLVSDKITTGSCVLGSIVLTGTATGIINIYDATTTNASLRAASQSTSSILLANIPASAAAGTYTFDAQCTRGLIIDSTGTMPTTTITFR